MSDSDLNLDGLIAEHKSVIVAFGDMSVVGNLSRRTMRALESTAARLREAEAVIYSIESEVQDFSQSDNDAMVTIERRLAAYRQTTNREDGSRGRMIDTYDDAALRDAFGTTPDRKVGCPDGSP